MIHPHADFLKQPTLAPIGVFDSGIGGLSVLNHLSSLMPHESYIYYADTQNVPYGNKSSDEILFLTLQAVDWLCKKGCKLIVLACNSASAHALMAVRERCSVPIVGLVPALKPACEISKTRQVAVLATQATLDGKLLKKVIHEVADLQGVKVHKHFEPKLVPWVESGMPIDHQVADLLIKQTKTWYQMGVDVLVLGCTHYPFFREFLQNWIDKEGVQMTLIDSGAAIAQRVRYLLEFFCIAKTMDTNQPTLKFYASKFDDSLAGTIQRLSCMPICFVDSDFNRLTMHPVQ